MSLLDFRFIMIYVIYKMLVLLKKTKLKYVKNSIFESFFKVYTRLFLYKLFRFTTHNDGVFTSWEENIIKDIRNLFKFKTELNYTAIKDIRNLFRLEKVTEAIKDRILRDIKNLFEHAKEDENYYKTVRVSNDGRGVRNGDISNGDRNKTLSVEGYLNQIRTYLKDIINNLKKIWKVKNSTSSSKKLYFFYK